MSKRLLVAAIAAVLLAGAAGCSTDEATPAATLSTATTEVPTTLPTDDPRSAIVGTWRADAADWTVYFNEDGTFTEDFEGNVDFRSGEYRVEDDVVYLDGGDGETTEGELSGDTINFKLGMLERR